MPLRVRLLSLALVGGLGALTVMTTGLLELEAVDVAEQQADVYEEGIDSYRQLAAAREHLRGEVLLGEATAVKQAARDYLVVVDEHALLGLPGTHAEQAEVAVQMARDLGRGSAQVTGRAGRPAFLAAELQTAEAEAQARESLDAAAEQAEAVAIEVREAAQLRLAVSGGLTVLVLTLLALLLGRSLVAGLRRMADVAEAVSSGDLAARTGLTSTDELGTLGRALDTMADSAQRLLSEQRVETDHQLFAQQLGAALEHADDQDEVLQVTTLAMQEALPGRPVELLLADSSRAHLTPVAVSATHGGPGCKVLTPHGCPAVRSGSAVVMSDSTTLDACPHLRARSDVADRAVCIPVTFMGRALGVLHTTSAGPAAPGQGDADVRRLRTLAGQVSGRLGTVGALAQAELQASTDSLTGLANRRSIEQQLRTLHQSGAPYALLLADLDHFKSINDTYGHEAGDRALRVFASSLPGALRVGDLAGRWGGKEFLLLLPATSLNESEQVAVRVQQRLRTALERNSCPPFTISVGIADSFCAAGIDEQVARADEALASAKAGGRDRVVIAGQVVTGQLPADGDGAALVVPAAAVD